MKFAEMKDHKDMKQNEWSPVTLDKTANMEKRITIITMLHDEAESRVLHCDTFRQRNMNYALAIFAGLIAVEIKIENVMPHYVISTILTILMIIFTVWDRRWHRTKHGWEATSLSSYKNLAKLVNGFDDPLTYNTYEAEAEETAEWPSLQPIVFYFLIVASIVAFCVIGK